MSYVGQIFGKRKVICDTCQAKDWTSIGLRIPSRPDKYKLTMCLNCGHILPCEIGNLHRQPPKRCVFCSNIGNHSNVKTDTNTWAVYASYAVCNITYDKQVVQAYVDLPFYDMASKYTWRISKKKQKYYVVTGSSKKGTMVYMHEMNIGKAPDGFEIDHIDGNSLNNRRDNLRFVNHQQNVDNQLATRIDNQIGIRGVVFVKNTRKYKVDFYHHGIRFYTKDWDTIEEAVWCRTCFEDYFGLEAIRHNPLAKQYDTLTNESKEVIKQYVYSKILGNERY